MRGNSPSVGGRTTRKTGLPHSAVVDSRWYKELLIRPGMLVVKIDLVLQTDGLEASRLQRYTKVAGHRTSARPPQNSGGRRLSGPKANPRWRREDVELMIDGEGGFTPLSPDYKQRSPAGGIGKRTVLAPGARKKVRPSMRTWRRRDESGRRRPRN